MILYFIKDSFNGNFIVDIIDYFDYMEYIDKRMLKIPFRTLIYK